MTSKITLLRSKLDILLQLYRFRFGTADLLARAVGLKDGRYSYTRLKALAANGYIGKQYDKTYKQLGKPASYHLLTSAFPILRQSSAGNNEGILVEPQALRAFYRDKSASDQFSTLAAGPHDI